MDLPDDHRGLRGLTAVVRVRPAVICTLLGMVLLAACGGSSKDETSRYENDATYRRATLAASLVNPANGYSALRLARYESGHAGDWAALPEWNPPTEIVSPSEVAAGTNVLRPVSAAAKARDLEDDLLTLGEDAFFHYPTQLTHVANATLASPAEAAKDGLWSDETRGTGGMVRVALPDGTTGVSLTCSTCHVRAAKGGLIIGAGNDKFDFGQMIADAREAAGDLATAWRAWGPGRVDVTTPTGVEPVRIPDLRPVRWLTHLQQDATVQQTSLDALAIRLETLIITSNAETVRPPRRVALALATYIWSLSATVAPPDPTSDAERSGQVLFARECSGCHQGDALTGPPVSLGAVGTDPTFGHSSDRQTGMYRVPSLLGVGSRGMLLHDASLPSVAAMFDPSRTSASFTGGRRPGAVVGHPFGLELDDGSRAALVAYVSSR